jgi:antagonist of KipI
MTLEIIEPGFLTTIQDTGRKGFEHYGVPISGGMDRFALMAANRLVENHPDAAVLEFIADGPILYAWDDCLIALTGGEYDLKVNKNPVPTWSSVRVRAGSFVQVGVKGNPMWGYLAFRGGIQTPVVMKSRSTYLRGKFGGLEGRTLQKGDYLPVPELDRQGPLYAGRDFLAANRPDYRTHPIIRVVMGPQANAFTSEGLNTFLNEEYRLTMAADRMGYRLEGPPIEHLVPADILSDGIMAGSIQVPANGQPMVLMSDSQTTGGYTKIATVIMTDLPVLAQCQPETSQIRFQAVSVEEAQFLYRKMMQKLADGIVEAEETDLKYISF